MENSEKILSKEEIILAEDVIREVVFVPEWNGSVIVKTMTAKERDSWEHKTYVLGRKDPNSVPDNVRASLFAATVVDENGNRMFTDEDVETLNKKSGSAVDRVTDVARKLNRMRAEDLATETKNLSAGQSEDSISG